MASDNKARYRRTRMSASVTSDVFISWSGQNSKEIAIALKNMLENIFKIEGMKCFMSDKDIASGRDWWDKIKEELKACKVGIICITKENIYAPWIYFEAGAMISQDVPSVIPLLINCDIKSIKDTPLNKNNAVNFYDEVKFKKMVNDIYEAMHYESETKDKDIIDTMASKSYVEMKKELESVLSTLKDSKTISAKQIYPNHTRVVKQNTIYVSAPMSSIESEEYIKLRECMLKVEERLKRIGFKEVYCPINEKEEYKRFDGKTKAIMDNFPRMKTADSMLVVIPQNLPSSILVEIGYAIALSKRTVIFYKETLPYILEEAGETIQNIKTYHFLEYNEIEEIIVRNEMNIFVEGYSD